MQRVVYAFDWGCLTTRLGAHLTYFVMLPLGAGIFVLPYYEAPRDVMIGYAFVLLPILVVSQALIFVKTRPRPRNYLRLDADGLTHACGGRTRRWAWSEVSEFKMHGRLHPAALILGPSISFRVPADARQGRLAAILNRILFRGDNAAIGDNYLSYVHDMAPMLNLHRDRALSRGPRSERASRARMSGAPSEPDVFLHREHSGRKGKLSRPALFVAYGLGGAALGFGLVYVVRHGWPASLSELHGMTSVSIAVSAAVIGAIYSAIEVARRQASAQNLIVLSSGGLQLRRNGEQRHWHWHEMCEPELRRTPTASAEGTAFSVSFSALHDGTRPGKVKPDAPSAGIVQSLEDVYDLPLERMVHQLRAWREATLEAESALDRPETPPTPDAAAAARPAAEEAVSFRRRWAPATSALTTAGLWLMQVPMLSALAVSLWTLTVDLPRGPEIGLLAGCMVVAFAAPILTVFLCAGGRWNNLRLDRDGLAYLRLGRRAAWSWNELSSFDLVNAKPRWSRKKGPVITFAVPRDDRLSRFMRWAYGIRTAQPVAVIEDVYETPPGEIARRLVEHRKGAASKRTRAAPR